MLAPAIAPAPLKKMRTNLPCAQTARKGELVAEAITEGRWNARSATSCCS